MEANCSKCNVPPIENFLPCKNGHLDCLKITYEIADKENVYLDMEVAAGAGKLDCLRFLHEKGFPLCAELATNSAFGGHINCLKYCHDNGCILDASVMYYSAIQGNLECLIYAIQNNCEWNEAAVTTASHSNRNECLKYMYESCRDKISNEVIELYIQPKIDKWKSLVDIMRSQMEGVPADIWNIIYTYWS